MDIFQSTLSSRRATHVPLFPRQGLPISIHALLTESDISKAFLRVICWISIHALLTESDGSDTERIHVLQVISIHALLTESDEHALDILPASLGFQSTLSSRRATTERHSTTCGRRYFNPRSPHGERLERSAPPYQSTDFNPRSPHGERLMGCGVEFSLIDFNPRSPHGERRGWLNLPPDAEIFQSTLSSRRATAAANDVFIFFLDFNPRSPHGERLRLDGG